ncbi:hypothetical protein OG978_47900 (plasmid) [Streptomyces sp. NBC_01591]|uniref:hypothetical protein n=1 Tax=Streptomyces sp. NBC_01591 TaxID=2975888 RepID=UPI002DDC5159|nr:hypothetical protein [Streptomyces sp. NBC_01591]WSD74709.1 hypothetical protein OG978_47900 [Streptomyces sp. NBC_01591]
MHLHDVVVGGAAPDGVGEQAQGGGRGHRGEVGQGLVGASGHIRSLLAELQPH